MNINAVIVTYNRKVLLKRCLDAVINQSYSVQKIFVIDNASTDGSKEYLINSGFHLDCETKNPNTITGKIIYHKLKENLGGAGGFNEGIKKASPGVDYVWIMDDDGYPTESCLENLLNCKDKSGYIMPISLCPGEKDRLTWFLRKRNKKFTRSYKELCDSFPERIMSHAVPFNGLLLDTSIVQTVGLPKKEMFIWGDDFEFQYRCISFGIKPVTNLDAIFYHPDDKAQVYRIFFNTIPVNYTESKLRFTCLIRNSSYNYWKYNKRHIVLLKFFLYSWLFLVKKRFAIKEYIHYLKCVKDGIQGNFERHLKYLD